MKKYYLLFLLTGFSFFSRAQVGIGTPLPNASSQLDVRATNKGILIPRVSLTSTQDKVTITEGNVNSLLVFNTQTINDIVPGYYYWYIDKWYRMGSGNAETITTLVDNNNGTITYINEKGLPVTINLASGPQGIAGINGADGKSAFEVWKETTNNSTATITEYLAATKGETGSTGANGLDGKGISSTVVNTDGTITITYTDGTTVTTSSVKGPKGDAGTVGTDGTNGTNGINGNNGLDGKGISSTVVNADGTITITYTDGTTVTTSSVKGPKGDTGTNGTNGNNGLDGKGISSTVVNADGTITITYTDGTTATTSSVKGPKGDRGTNGNNGLDGKGISSTVVNTDGTITITYTDGTTATTSSVKGPKGDTGTNGTNGNNGLDGKGISSTVVNADGTITITYTDGTTATTSSVKGPKGDTGTNGTNGNNGLDGKGISSTVVNTDGTITITYTDGTTSTTSSVKGPKGDTGAAGIGGKSNAGTGISISGTGTDTDAYIISTNAIDADKQTLTDLSLNSTTNVLSATIERGNTKTVDLSGLSLEPWKIQATTENAKLNDQDIYQKGKVAIGTTSATAVSSRQLDVVGDFRTRYANGNFNSGFESNFTEEGIPINLSYIANNADVMAATERSMTSLYQGVATMDSTNGSGGGSLGAFSTSRGGTAGIVATDASGQVSSQIWGYSDPSVQSQIVLSHIKSSGESSRILIEKLKGVTFDFTKSDGTIDGSFTFPRNSGTINQILTTDGNSNAQLVWKDIASIGVNYWSLTGNANTVPATNFLGTTDAQDLVFRTNNLERLRITKTGRLDLSNTSGNASNIFVEGGNETVTGIFNTAVGRSALANVTTGNQNTALGSQSLSSVKTGSSNIGVGDRSLTSLTTGQSNTTVGGMSGIIATSGNFNSMFGFQSASALTTGSSNTFFGSGSGSGVTTGSKNIAIGSNTSFASNTANNQLNIGNNIFGTGLTGTITTPAGNIGIGTAAPNNTLEIKSTATNTSGLTFTNLNSSSPAVSGANLGVNSSGQVVVVPSAVQTVTTITNTVAGHKIADYTNEVSTPVVVPINETVTSLIVNATRKTLDYTDENQATHNLNLAPLVSEPWYSNTTNTGAVSNTDQIYTLGTWVGIGTQTKSTAGDEALRVNGKIRTTATVYADYVFEDYFKGFSEINKSYKFKSLKEVDDYIKANKHLPGITPIQDLEKVNGGYSVDITTLSIQNLEKVEELYLHIIDQQKQIDMKNKQIEDLKKASEDMNERLKKIERFLNK